MSEREAIASGPLARRGLVERAGAGAEVLARARAEGIETVRLLFPDQHGILRGKTLTAAALPGALAAGIGVPSTLLLKDTSHRTVFPVWEEGAALGDLPLGGAGDVTLVPDPATFAPLPQSPHSAVILCDVAPRAGGGLLPFAPRQALRLCEARLAEDGLALTVGLEVEFHVLVRDGGGGGDGLGHEAATMPPRPPRTRNLTAGWQYLTEGRYGEAEDVLDEIRRAAEALSMDPRTVEIEMGPSQFEFTFGPAAPLVQADRFVLFRSLAREICRRRGLLASFMAKPRLPNAAASGWHIHQSLSRGPRNLFQPEGDALTEHASGWIAGLLGHASACCLLTNPTVTSYKRFAPHQLAPDRIAWGRDNRGAMLRALVAPDDPASRIENRVADASANPHFALAAQILAGLDGIARGAAPPAETRSPYDGPAETLPASLGAAIDAFEASDLFAPVLGPAFVPWLARLKRAEWDRYLAALSEWEQAEYFGLY